MFRRLSIESLENRRVLAATPGTASLVNGQLDICGTDANDVIIIAETPNGIFVNIAEYDVQENIGGATELFSQFFARNQVSSITASGGAGDDRIFAFSMTSSVNLNGEAGNDTLAGGSAADVLDGGDGDDVLHGRNGNDTLLGGAGVDILLGDGFTADGTANVGDDTISGGAGEDRLFGHLGNDTLNGGDDDDDLYGDEGDDTLNGDAGNDVLNGDSSLNQLHGNDTLNGGAGNDDIIAKGGDDEVNGGDGDDGLSGGEGSDTMVGGAGNDTLNGDAGADALSGGTGTDTLMGGAGDDVLVGGEGADTLDGEADDDALVAGLTTGDDAVAALSSSVDGWANRASYDGGINAVQSALTPSTVDDLAIDTITGSEGQDAYFVSQTLDVVSEREAGETVVGRDLSALNDTYYETINQTLTKTAANGLLANDSDSVGGLTVSTTPITAPSSGTLSLNADGSFTYEHTGGTTGVDSFVYEATNADGSTSQATATINIADYMISEQAASNALAGQVTPTQDLGDDVVFDFVSANGADDPLSIAFDDHLAGDLDGSVVLIDYSDLECPTCAIFRGYINELKQQFPDELLTVTRHLPLDFHLNATEAALFAEAAGQQGEFDAMFDLLFERQSDWASLPDPTATFQQYAAELGLDATDVMTVVNDPATAARVDRDVQAAFGPLQLSSTPSLFINGEQISTSEVPTVPAFAARIQQAIDANTSPIMLNRETGELRVARFTEASSDPSNEGRLDFETNPTFTVDVIARGSMGSEIIPVTFNVTDELDMPSLPAGATPTTTASGLGFYDFELGDGATPVATDGVRVDYTGYLPSGEIFDSNTGTGFELMSVVAGFSEGIQGMQVGGTRRLILPADLGYGPQGGNPRAGIGAEDTIIFDVTLLEIL